MLARLGHPCVDAARECLGNGLHAGPIARPFSVDVAAILHAPRRGIAFDEIQSEHLRQPALYRPAPEVHLKKTILRLHEALGEKQIALVLRVDVRHAPPVAYDANGLRDSTHDERAGYLRQRCGGRCERRRCRLATARHGAEHAQTNHQPQ